MSDEKPKSAASSDTARAPAPSFAGELTKMGAAVDELERAARLIADLVRENDELRRENDGYRDHAMRAPRIPITDVDDAPPVAATASLQAISKAVGVTKDGDAKPLVTRGENRWLTLAIALLVAISTAINAFHH